MAGLHYLGVYPEREVYVRLFSISDRARPELMLGQNGRAGVSFHARIAILELSVNKQPLVASP